MEYNNANCRRTEIKKPDDPTHQVFCCRLPGIYPGNTPTLYFYQSMS